MPNPIVTNGSCTTDAITSGVKVLAADQDRKQTRKQDRKKDGSCTTDAITTDGLLLPSIA
jgi:hypothetical protein